MGRHQSNSLKYFPLVVGFFSDKRIRRMIFRFGGDGPLFYLYILCAAYGGAGYYVAADDDFIEDASTDLQCSREKIGLMLNYLLDKSLLDRTLFSTVKVLTSHGIQAQYQESVKGLKRDIEVDGKLWLLDETESLGFIKVRPNENKSGKNADKSGGNPDKSGKKDTNKIKENKKKEKEREDTRKRFVPPTLEEVEAYARQRQSAVDPKRFFDFFSAGGWVDSKGNPVQNWKQKFITWEHNSWRAAPQMAPPEPATPKAGELERLRKIREQIRKDSEA